MKILIIIGTIGSILPYILLVLLCIYNLFKKIGNNAHFFYLIVIIMKVLR